MPRPKQTTPTPEMYVALAEAPTRRSQNETNDCGVIAVAAVCRVPYGVAWAKLNELGRKSRKGTPTGMIFAAVRHFGFELEQIFPKYFLQDRYPEWFSKTHQFVTTHHPERFKGPGCPFRPGEAYLMLNRNGRHITAIVDSQTIDWSKGRSIRAEAYGFYRVNRAVPHSEGDIGCMCTACKKQRAADELVALQAKAMREKLELQQYAAALVNMGVMPDEDQQS